MTAGFCFAGGYQVAKFQPGQSGNPKGRPPKERSLSTLLEKAGDKTVMVDGKPVPGKRLVADLVWEALTSGSVLLPENGHTLHLDSSEWLTLAKWVYAQVDGPPKAEVDLTSGGEALTFTIDIDRPNGGQSDE